MAILDINLALVFGVIDMLLGGQGNVETEIRVPTDIEVAIIHPFIEKLLEKLTFCWNSFIQVDLKVKRTESNPEYIQAAPVDAPVIVLAFDAKIGNANGIINICYPLPMIQAANDQLDSAAGQMDSYYGKKTDDSSRANLIKNVLNIPMPITVELGGSKVRGSELSSLQPGDVVVFDKKITDPLTMFISGLPVFDVYPGKGKESLVVKVVDHVHSDGDSGEEVNISI
jgi:flagellar motor switch protein FliM